MTNEQMKALPVGTRVAKFPGVEDTTSAPVWVVKEHCEWGTVLQREFLLTNPASWKTVRVV